MTRFITSGKLKRILIKAAAILFWVAAWQLLSVKIAQELLIASPLRVFARLFELCLEAFFWRSVLFTLLRVAAGFLFALIAGTALAVVCARFNTARALVSPLFGAVRATPVASFIILALLWLPTDRLPAFIAFFMVVPVVWSNIYAGITQADRELLEMAKVFRFSKTKIISSVYMPSVMPFFISACSVGLGFAWKSAIAAEVICLPRASIGRQLHNAKIYLETPDLFAWTIAVIILSVLLEKLTLVALNRLVKKPGKERGGHA